jgi:Secretory lipase
MRYITRPTRRTLVVPLVVGLVTAILATPAPARASAAQHGPGTPFYTYTGSTPLASVPPGTVLASRTFTYWGLLWPVHTVQLLYRSTGVLGQPTTNVTSVLLPTGGSGPAGAISDQIAYDSLNPGDEPSVSIHNGDAVGDDLAPLLTQGITVIVPDTEGQNADIAEGRQYGMNTLDSIRAATGSPLTGLTTTTPVALEGYSGGAWATEWAAQLAPSYAPDVNRQLTGAAEGGLPVDAAHIASYISGSSMFTAEIPMALIGLARAYGTDFTRYLSAEGITDFRNLQDASLGTTIWRYPGLTISSLFQPQYANPDSIPEYVRIANQENLGLVSPATIPLFIVQGGAGWPEGAQPQPPGIGIGDGATVTGDVRTLARQACATGTPVSYHEYDNLDHLSAALVWGPAAQSWLLGRLNGTAAPDNCPSIPAGNSLAPQRPVPPGTPAR